MRPDALRLSRPLQGWLYGTVGVLFVSGAGWWLLDRWFQLEGEFGPQPHPAQHWLLLVHGAAAMVTLLVLGALVPVHVLRGWRAHLNRPNGLFLASSMVALVVTGYLLYYAGSEHGRAVAATLHLWLGLALPAIIALHAWAGRRSRRKMRPPLRTRED